MTFSTMLHLLYHHHITSTPAPCRARNNMHTHAFTCTRHVYVGLSAAIRTLQQWGTGFSTISPHFVASEPTHDTMTNYVSCSTSQSPPTTAAGSRMSCCSCPLLADHSAETDSTTLASPDIIMLCFLPVLQLRCSKPARSARLEVSRLLLLPALPRLLRCGECSCPRLSSADMRTGLLACSGTSSALQQHKQKHQHKQQVTRHVS